MTQNTRPDLSRPETKEQYVAQYFGCEVLRYNNSDDDEYWNKKIFPVDSHNLRCNLSIMHLLLTPLSRITDEHLEIILPIVAKTSYYHSHTTPNMVRQVFREFLNKESTIHGADWWHIQDILRSLGYAVSWMGYSVEELIAAGYCQLRKEGGEDE